ncbi:hypothetical protein B0I35DRAFT_482705 [Stachybotrys elegans]|uniref:Hydrophobin n=1 Tax=Stachybotrys elegans TaxID=80388 RepID=A0A8K0SIC9_9HYPO|nr:hypothetical protein B0I35DRAFT_482705 [Stachybotrys elegans]
MQFTTITALALAVAGAIAAPEAEAGRYNRPSYTNNKNWHSGNNNNNDINKQTIYCGSESGAFCCSPEYESSWGSPSKYNCKSFVGSCNAITVCCANSAQDKSGAVQKCSGLGSVAVSYS